MTPVEMYEQHTLNTIANKVAGFRKLEEARQLNFWEATRWQTLHLINIQLPTKDRMKKYTDLPLPWEHEEVKKLDPKEFLNKI
jgi:hypothetical protein